MQYRPCGLTESDITNMSEKDKNKLLKTLLKEYGKLKSGVIWTSNDDTVEKFNPEIDFSIPIIERMSELDINSCANMPANHLIVGDNYTTLCALQHKYKGQIGFVYCDVPYNTGTRDFKYNDHYVDATDQWRHSKWLSFIDKRFRLIKRLLKPSGVFAVSIADNEFAQLTLLMDEIFGQKNRICISPVIVNQGGKKSAGISMQHEYLLIYANNNNLALETLGVSAAELALQMSEDDGDDGEDNSQSIAGLSKNKTYVLPVDVPFATSKSELVEKSGITARPLCDKQGPFSLRILLKNGGDSLRADRPNMYYPIYYILPTETDNFVSMDRGSSTKTAKVYIDTKSKLSLIKPDVPYAELLPVDKETGIERRWRWGRDKVQAEIDKGAEGILIVKVDKTKSGEPVMQIYSKERDKYLYKNTETEVAKKAKTVQSIFSKPEYATQAGTSRLEEIFGVKNMFDYPKPVLFIEDLIMIFSKPDDLIADFFAGSGTTGEAVMQVNKKYGRDNRFILATNNENNIATEITQVRLNALSTGVFKGKTKIKEEPIPVKLLVYKISEIDSRNVLDVDSPDEFVQPMILDVLEPSITGYNALVYGADYIIFQDNSIIVQVNTFDKILVITELGRSAFGNIRDPELYDYLAIYLEGIQDYKKIFVQYTVDELPKGIDGLIEESEIYTTTYPTEYLNNIKFAVTATIDKSVCNFNRFESEVN